MSSKALHVRDLMSGEVVTVSRNDTLAVAEQLMKSHRIRHLAVLDEDGVLCGVLGQTDLFRGALLRALGYGSRAEKQLLESLSVKEAMRENPITTGADVALAKAARLMREHQVRCLPVVDGERLLGMLSESDFVRVVAES